MYTNEEIAYIWLSRVGSLTPKRREYLLSLSDSVVDLLDGLEDYSASITADLGEDEYARLLKGKEEEVWVAEINALDRMGAVAITMASPRYQEAWLDLPQPPIVLYAKGNLDLLESRCFAVVGTRTPSRYGKDVTENFVADLAMGGLTIVSGLARGVDTIAHRTTLQYEKPTIGVLPCGLDKVYPAENNELYAQIAEKGLLITEYPLGTGVQQYTFVERNRIIAMLSSGVLVTEAGEKSGASITVTHALELSKDIFIVPGNIYSKTSLGTNRLLKEMQGALVTSSADILECYHVNVDTTPVNAMQLDIVETAIMGALEDGDKHIEDLLAITGLTVSQISPVLTKLELIGLIHRLSGNYYGV